MRMRVHESWLSRDLGWYSANSNQVLSSFDNADKLTDSRSEYNVMSNFINA
jgi:hypothetical protein